jgi:SAM-dependent methyltransferase
VAQCPLCGKSDAQDYARFPEMTWVRCSCGLIYKHRARQSPGVSAIHGEAPVQAVEHHHVPSFDWRVWWRIIKAGSQIRGVLNHVPRGTVLDVGCSLGYTLLAARGLGLGAAGVDTARYAIDACRRIGFRAEIGQLSRLPYRDKLFGVVMMKHVLEHTPDPRQALREVRRVLAPGGGLFIAVPNADYKRAARDPVRSSFYRPDDPDAIERVVCYTSVTLSRLLEEEGFHVVRIHPHLFHRAAAPWLWLVQVLLFPFRFVLGRAITALGLRKELWLVAVERVDWPGHSTKT